MKMLVPLATQLHEQQKVCLRKLNLCNLYESLGVASCNLIDQAYLDSLQIGVIWLLQLWLNATFAPVLHTENSSDTVVGGEGVWLARITPDDGNTVLHFFMFFKRITFVSTMALFATRNVSWLGSANFYLVLVSEEEKAFMVSSRSVFAQFFMDEAHH